MLLGGGGDLDDLEESEIEQFAQTGTVSDEIAEQSREEGGGLFSDRNFLDFEGDFSAEISDNESLIDINQFAKEDSENLQDSPTALLLYALMSGEENDLWFRDQNLDRWEVIGNLKDWIDPDTVRSSGLGGYEDTLYNNLDPAYLTKNAGLDTMEEIRLIEGWQDKVFDRFGDKLTIWSHGKINLNSVDIEFHKALIRGAALTPPTDAQLDQCIDNDDGDSNTIDFSFLDTMTFDSAQEYADAVKANCGIELDDSKLNKITSSSQVFTVKSTGLVGTSAVTITAILDFSSRSAGETVYWRID